METEYANLSEQTKLEMELGKKMAAANAAAYALAERTRTIENGGEVVEDPAAVEAALNAKPIDITPQDQPVFPVAQEKYQPKKR
jgi:hypothetical protein